MFVSLHRIGGQRRLRSCNKWILHPINIIVCFYCVCVCVCVCEREREREFLLSSLVEDGWKASADEIKGREHCVKLWYLDSWTCLGQSVHSLLLSSLVPQCLLSYHSESEIGLMEPMVQMVERERERESFALAFITWVSICP